MDQCDHRALIIIGVIWTKPIPVGFAAPRQPDYASRVGQSGTAVITKEFGVHVAASSRQRWPGLLRTVLNARWETEPGWIALTFDSPVLCVLLDETGGRCQIRMQPEQPAQGEYFGTGHLSFVATSQPVAVHATEMRSARIALYQLDLHKSDCLSPDQASVIARAENRYMFRNERLFECARLLGEHQMTKDPDIFGLSLARALQLALHGALLGQPKSRSAARLTGARFAEVLSHINDHLDQRTVVTDLAQISNMSPAQFGRSFQEATGMSLQRWQMDARIRSAQRLMIDDPAESLSAIAALVGFSDSSHFTRAFLEIVGTTPTAWLRQRT
jgi:AraC family transcriptional regulator